MFTAEAPLSRVNFSTSRSARTQVLGNKNGITSSGNQKPGVGANRFSVVLPPARGRCRSDPTSKGNS